MPPEQYTLIHRDAPLTDVEADRLVAALRVLDDGRNGGGGDGGGGDDDENGDDRGGED